MTGRVHPLATRLASWLAAGSMVACTSQLDIGLGAADATSTGALSDTTGSTSIPSRESADATDTGPDDSSSGAAPTSSTTAGETTTAGDTDAPGDNPCASEQKVCVQVDLDGTPAGFCGQTLELKGIVQSIGPGVWSIEDCDGCELCGGPVYDVEFFAPPGWAPTELPLCSRIAIDFAPLDVSPFACAFTGAAIWGDDGTSEDPAPVYVAASITTDPPATVSGLEVFKEDVEPKPCDESSCCSVAPGKYSITFSGAGIGMPVELAEHEEALGVGAFGRFYDIRNESSHADAQCDRIPHFDWIFRR